MITSIAFENKEPVLTHSFDPTILDSPEDIMREKLDQGFGALEIVEEYIKERHKETEERIAFLVREKNLEFIRKFTAMVLKEKKMKVYVYQHMWLSDLASRQGLSLPDLAKRCGVSKQAFQQGAERLRGEFDYPLNEHERKEEARENMRAAHIPRI